MESISEVKGFFGYVKCGFWRLFTSYASNDPENSPLLSTGYEYIVHESLSTLSRSSNLTHLDKSRRLLVSGGVGNKGELVTSRSSQKQAWRHPLIYGRSAGISDAAFFAFYPNLLI